MAKTISRRKEKSLVILVFAVFIFHDYLQRSGSKEGHSLWHRYEQHMHA
jgi:hypothetical protein